MTQIVPSAILNTILRPRINNQITAPELRVLDEGGENLGIMKLADALAAAKAKGTDLIEISAAAKPPVARIMSFDKFRYQEEKKLKKQRVAEKGGEFKQVQVGIGTAANDLRIKAEKVNEFLKEGHRVEIIMVLRGRQKANKDFAMEKLRQFLTVIDPNHKVAVPPRFGMRGIMVQVSK